MKQEELNFVKQFDGKPSFEPFNDYIKKYPKARMGVNILNSSFKRYGILNFTKLFEDRLMPVQRDPNTFEIVEYTQKTNNDNSHYREMTFGQHDENGLLDGVGRRITVCVYSCDIWEGHWKYGDLTGFGRWLTIYWNDGSFRCHVG